MVALACCSLLTASPARVEPSAEPRPTAPSAPSSSASPESTGSAYFISGSVFLTPTTPSTAGEPPRARRAPTPDERQQNRKVWGFAMGVGSFGGAASALAIGFGVGLRNYRTWGRELDTLITDIEAHGGRTGLDNLDLALYNRRMDGARRLMIGTSIAAVVCMGVGAGLLSWSLKGGWSPRRARLSPYGGPQEAGLTLVGRF